MIRWLLRFTCHGMPERCLQWRGKPMPICSRCVGIHAGIVVGAVMGMILLPEVMDGFTLPWLLGATAALIPLAVDGGGQLLGWWTSTHPRRLATGLLAGVGVTAPTVGGLLALG